MNKNPKIENLKPFKKGQSGNPKGRTPNLPALNELMAKVMGEMGESGITAMEVILKAIRSKAAKGDVRSAEMLFDRAYGKAKEFKEITGKNGQSINLIFNEIERKDVTGEKADTSV